MKGDVKMASIKDYGNGKYRVLICDGYLPNGKLNRLSKTITAKTKTDLKKQVEALEVDFIRRGKKEEKKDLTFNELVEKWRKHIVPELAEKTQVRYEGLLEDFIRPYFGRWEVSGIKPMDIQDYISTLKEDGIRKDKKQGGYAKKTLQHHYTLLSSIFERGMDWKIISDNPCKGVKKPKVDAREPGFYEDEQIDILLEKLEQEKMMYKVYAHVALFSGCRRSEVLGLEWEDINFNNNTIRVCKTSQYTGANGIFTRDKLKNSSTSRTITMPEETMELLKEYKAEQEKQRTEKGDQWIVSNRLFIAEEGGKRNKAGGPIHPDTISQWFERFLKESRLPRITLHEVRHTHISYLLNNGMELDAVSKRAGHRDATVTSRIYGHLFEKTKREGANIMGQIYKRKENEG